MSYFMGFHYDQVNRGDGWNVEAGNLIFQRCTKKSTQSLKRQLKENGFTNSEIKIYRNIEL